MVVLVVAAAVFSAACGGASSERVIVASGTTLVDSGFIDAVVDIYEEENPGYEISVVANSTRLVLELGRQKAADLLITHAPGQEAAFMAEDLASRHAPVFASRFVLVGPASWSARARSREIHEVLADVRSPGSGVCQPRRRIRYSRSRDGIVAGIRTRSRPASAGTW